MLHLIAIAVFVAAQPQPPAGEKTGDFIDTVRQADEQSRAQNWMEAAPLWQRVVETNPHVAAFWFSLGLALQNTGENRQAISALEKAQQLGASYPHTVAYFLARSQALAGDKQAALGSLEKAMALGFRYRDRIRGDQAFASLKDDPAFRNLTGAVDTAQMSRTEGWAYDISFLEREVKRMHYAPFRKVPQAEVEAELRRIKDEAADLTDGQIIVRLMAAMKKIGDGHTGIYP